MAVTPATGPAFSCPTVLSSGSERATKTFVHDNVISLPPQTKQIAAQPWLGRCCQHLPEQMRSGPAGQFR